MRSRGLNCPAPALAAATALAIAALAAAAVAAPSPADERSSAAANTDPHRVAAAPAEGDRQAEVRKAGAQVMPFSLDRTLHTFDKTADGGIQRVHVRGAAADQVAMVRSHLRAIAEAFAARDFSAPAHIHGAGMPGLTELQNAAPGELSVAYREIDDGAELTYAGHSPTIVAAIHRWFDAQLADHGHDAATTPFRIELSQLAWLGGTWIADDATSHVEEIWATSAPDLLIGMSHATHDGHTSSFEFLRIAARDDGVFYIAQPRGRPPVEFPLRSWDGTTAVFENSTGTDRVKRIAYRKGTDGTMSARIEGSADGKDFVENFNYRRPPRHRID